MKIHKRNSTRHSRLMLFSVAVFIILSTSVKYSHAESHCNAALDLLFVIDASYSIKKPEFNATLELVSDVITDMRVDRMDKMKAGAIFYAKTVYPERINLSVEQNNVTDRILNFERNPQNIGTNTAAALKVVFDIYNNRPVPKWEFVAVLLTDGKSENVIETKKAADVIATEGGIHMIAIGIGKNVDVRELKDIDSTFETIETIQSTGLKDVILNRICTAAVNAALQVKLRFNIYMVVDESSNVNSAQYKQSTTFVQFVMKRFKIDPLFAQVWVINCGTKVFPGRNLVSNNVTENNFYSDLASLRKNKFNTLRNTGECLSYVYYNTTIRSDQASNTKSIVTLIQSGETQDYSKTIAMASNIRLTGAGIITINVGNVISTGELRTAASSSASAFNVSGYDTLATVQESVVLTIQSMVLGTFGNGVVGAVFDLVFAVDFSSIDANGYSWDTLKAIMSDMLSNVDLSNMAGRVALILYDGSVSYTAISLDSMNDLVTFAAELNRIPLDQLVATRTPKADNSIGLDAMFKHFKTFLRSGAVRVGFLITSSGVNAIHTEASARQLRRAGIELYCLILAGQNIKASEITGLQRTATYAVSTTSDRVDYQLLADIKSMFISVVQSLPAVPGRFPWDAEVDLAILIQDDTGRSEAELKYFVNGIFSLFVFGPMVPSVFVFGGDVNENSSFSLGQISNEGQLTSWINGMSITSSGGKDIIPVLNRLKAMFEASSRPMAAKVAYLILNSEPTDLNQAMMLLNESRFADMVLGVVAVGDRSSGSSLRRLTYNPGLYSLQDNSLVVSSSAEAALAQASFGLAIRQVDPPPGPTNPGGTPGTGTGDCGYFMDIVVVLDGSNGLNSQAYVRLKTAFIEMFQNLGIGIKANAIGFISYSDKVHIEEIFHLTQSVTTDEVLTGILEQPWSNTSNAARTQAIENAVEMMEEEGRSNTLKTIILVSASPSFQIKETLEAAAKARDSGYILMVVEIGMRTIEAELKQIATSQHLVVQVDDVNQLSNKNILGLICTGDYECISNMNVVFIMDISDTNSTGTVQKAEDLIDKIVDSSVGSTDFTRIYTDGRDLPTTLEEAQDIHMRSSASSHYHLIMILTDQTIPDLNEIENSAINARYAGIMISVINMSGLTVIKWESVASSPSLVFNTESQDDELLTQRFIMLSICQVPCGDGQERSVSGTCEPCDMGFFRSSFQSITCVQCPPGKSTPTTGSTSNAACSVRKCDVPMDLVLVADGTESLGPTNFLLQKTALSIMLSFFGIGLGDNETRVARTIIKEVTTDADTTSLCNSTSAKKVRGDIQSIAGGAVSTNTASAIQAVIGIFESCQRDVPRVALVLTDGMSSSLAQSTLTFNTNYQSAQAQLAGITMMAFGIGETVFVGELQAIASPGLWFRVENANDLLRTNIQSMLCEVARGYKPPITPSIVTGDCPIKMDIMFVLDASASSQVFNQMKILIVDALKGLDIGPEKIRGGLLTFSDSVRGDFVGLDDTSRPGGGGNDLLRGEVMRQTPATNAGATTVLGEALKATTEIFRTQGRPFVARTAVILTAGSTDNNAAVAEAAMLARLEGIHIVAVGFETATLDELLSIATDKRSARLAENIGRDEDLLDFSCPLNFKCTSEVDIIFVWDLDKPPSFLQAERFISELQKSFEESAKTKTDNVFVDHVNNGAEAMDEALTKLNATGSAEASWIIVLITDKTIKQEDLPEFQRSAEAAKQASAVVFLVDIREEKKGLEGFSSNKLTRFSMESFDLPPHSLIIKRSLCIEPCSPGSERAMDGMCRMCLPGYFRPAGPFKKCSPCPARTTTQTSGATSESDCIAIVTCQAGSKRSPDGSSCIQCPEDTYQPLPQQDECFRCAPNLSTEGNIGAVSETDCRDFCNRKIDLILVVDSSISIAGSDFTFIKLFLFNLIASFRVGPEYVRIGLVPYAHNVSKGLDLASTTDRKTITTVVQRMTQYQVPGTITGQALAEARKIIQFQGRIAASTEEEQPNHIVVTITDGIPSDAEAAAREAELLRKDYVTSIVVAIKVAGTKTELGDIATSETSDFVVVNGFGDLRKLDISNLLCDTSFTCKHQVDVYFIRLFGIPLSDDHQVNEFTKKMIKGELELGFKETRNVVVVPEDLAGELKKAADDAGMTTNNPENTKLVLIFTDEPFKDSPELLDVFKKLHRLGIVTAVIYIASGNGHNFQTYIPDRDLIFEQSNILPYITFFERSLCLQPCQSGYERQITQNGTSCIKCSYGNVRSATLHHTCIRCPLGQTTPTEGATSLTACEDAVCPDAKVLCDADKKCIDRTYLCDGNVDCPDFDEIGCVDCPAGRFWDEATLSCFECPRNTYQPDEDKTSCIECPLNTITQKEGSSDKSLCFDPCTSGTEYNEVGLSFVCDKCDEGTYKDLFESAVCIPCQAGYTTPNKGSISGEDCEPDCSAGSKWRPTLERCENCDNNEYQDIPGQTTCLDCPAGTTTNFMGADERSDCTSPCIAGREYVGDKCRPCPRNTYRPPGADLCMDCPKNHVTLSKSSDNMDDCLPDCQEGTSFDEDEGECSPCMPGYYQPNKYNYECIRCPLWKTTAEQGATGEDKCTDRCGGGLEWTDTVCQPCPSDSYRKDNVNPKCVKCPDGFVQSSSGVKCLPDCKSGTKWYLDACMDCPYGYYQPNPNEYDCMPCEEGFTTPDTGSISADKCIELICEEGLFECPNRHICIPDSKRCEEKEDCYDNSDEWEENCRPCPSGHIIIPGDCVPCELGTFQPNLRQLTCVPCPERTTTLELGATSKVECVDPCEHGNQLSTDRLRCLPCPKGTYKDKSQSAECKPCPRGYTTDGSGAIRRDCCILKSPANKLDVIIAASMPKDISEANYILTRCSINGIIRRIDIGLESTRACVVQYARGVGELISLDDSENAERVLSSVNEMICPSAFFDRNTDAASAEIRGTLKQHQQTRPDARKVALIIINGQNDSPASNKMQTDKLAANDDVPVICIGVGENVRPEDCLDVASSPERVFIFPDKPTPDELDSVVFDLNRAEKCQRMAIPGSYNGYKTINSRKKEWCRRGDGFDQFKCRCVEIPNRRKREVCSPVYDNDIVSSSHIEKADDTQRLKATFKESETLKYVHVDVNAVDLRSEYGSLRPLAVHLTFTDVEDMATPRSLSAIRVGSGNPSMTLHITLMPNNYARVVVSEGNHSVVMALPYQKDEQTTLEIQLDVFGVSGQTQTAYRTAYPRAVNLQLVDQTAQTVVGRRSSKLSSIEEFPWLPYNGTVNVKLYSDCNPSYSRYRENGRDPFVQKLNSRN